ncbi:hypothetical protein AGROH133_14017 [Agrobacterium tumefaciens]|nr:hypothetical protein AGROH133_14017 [Agrobacterium tumefaciens]
MGRYKLSSVKKIRGQLFTGGQNFDTDQPTFRVEIQVYLAVYGIWITAVRGPKWRYVFFALKFNVGRIYADIITDLHCLPFTLAMYLSGFFGRITVVTRLPTPTNVLVAAS